MSLRCVALRPMLHLLMLCVAGILLPSMMRAQGARQVLPAGQGLGGESDTSMRVAAYQYFERSDSRSYDNSQLQSAAGSGQRLDSIYRLGSVAPAHCSEFWVHASEFNVKLDLGDDYNFGNNSFSVHVVLDVTSYNSTIAHNPITLDITNGSPEQLYHIDYHGSDSTQFSDLTGYAIKVTSYSASSSVQPYVRLSVWYSEEDAVGATSLSSPGSPVVAPISLAGATLHGNPTRLSWGLQGACDTFPRYQVQLLRLYNIDPAKTSQSDVKALVDWDQALTVETAGGEREIGLTVAEGTGYYLWRVRPIGSLYPWGVGDARNWGVWSDAPAQGSIVEYTAPNQTTPPLPDALFYYQQFDDDKNWLYSRSFSEEGRVSEGMSYMTPSGLPRQSQGRVRSSDSILAAQSVNDYSGRPSLGSVPAPVGKRTLDDGGQGYFGYVSGMLGSGGYAAEDFDADGNYRAPASASGNVGTYYSSSNPDKSIPSAEGYPYGRVLYAADGSGRVAEQSGVGPTHRLGGGAGGKERTLKVYYSSVSDMELVRLFGDEAPIDTSVRKMLVLDPNKVTAVQYMTKEGEVIATALQRSQGDTLLAALDESNGLSGTVSDTVRGNRSRGSYSFSSNKRLSFTDSTDLTIDYRITPNTLGVDACGSYCSTCDYRIRLILHNVDDPSATLEYPLTIGADECGDVAERSLVKTVRVPPGTYIVERRAETNTIDSTTITETDPFGRSYASAFRERIAHSMDSLIRGDDSLREVLRLLGLPKPDFDSLFSYLGVDPAEVSSRTIHTSCCDVVIPIVDPKCGGDPCREGTPDFEGHLIEMWGSQFAPPGDELNLNRYFKHDGADRYLDPPAAFPNGKGAFNFMIARMLEERNPDSSFVYDCSDLWNAWDVLVQNFGTLARKPGSGAYNPDFDLLDAFLSSVGRHFVGTSTDPYDLDDGYDLYAYKYFNHTVNPTGDCETVTGYNAGWVGNADSSARWTELYNCVQARSRVHTGGDQKMFDCFKDGDHPDIDTCAMQNKRQMEGECRDHCEDRYYEFREQILLAFSQAGQTLTEEQVACLASTMVDSCKSNCNLTVFSSTFIDSVGTQAEWAKMQGVWRYTVDVRLPVVDELGDTTCSSDSLMLYQGWRRPRTQMIVDYLNQKLEDFRATVGPDGGDWNFKSTLREIAPQHIIDSLRDSVVYVPGGDSSRFVYSGCTLRYETDTLIQGTPLNPHLAAQQLNRLLDTMWAHPEAAISAQIRSASFPAQCSYSGSSILQEVLQMNAPLDLHTYFLPLLATYYPHINGSHAPQLLYDFVKWNYEFEHGAYKWCSDSLWYVGYASLYKAGGDPYSDQRVLVRPTAGECPTTLTLVSDVEYAGDDSLTTTVQGLDGVDDLLPIYTLLKSRYTDVMGHFSEDSAGYLVYFDQFSADHAVIPYAPVGKRIFDLRFYRYDGKLLSTSICDTVVCPAICFGWKLPDTAAGTVDPLLPEPCDETAARAMLQGIDGSIARCIDNTLTGVEGAYRSTCANGDSVLDQLVISYAIDYYHFTLYYYDRAGNLVKTVPPKGVTPLSAGSANRQTHPSHGYVTEYEYDGLGQVIRTTTPDGGTSRAWYDKWGRPRFAQDQRQATAGEYSYVRYDNLGRPIESGVSTDMAAGDGFGAYADNQNVPSSGSSQRSYIVYDGSSTLNYLDGTPQHNLRNRVSRVSNDDGVTTYYSYDVHGNVEWTAEEILGLGVTNYTRYLYDLVSGNLREVRYNEGRVDRFYHRYQYDADNRLVQVETSRDGHLWDRDARYSYYEHGPLKRREIGEDKLQGIDYTYTADGQLKAINHPSLTPSSDPGNDGGSGSLFPADSFGVALGYYPGDFVHSGSPVADSASANLSGTPQYDGNISSTMSTIGHAVGGKFEGTTGESYRYDQAGRLLGSSFASRPAGGSWSSTTQYSTSYRYDANGNLDTLTRNAYTSGSSDAMDKLKYVYQSSSNKLDHVSDAVTGESYQEDINNTQTTGNYSYDGSGNLVGDAEASAVFEWNGDGTISQVKLTPSGGTTTVKYRYTASGERASKEVTTQATGDPTVYVTTTYYVHDARGLVMAIYERRCQGVIDSDGDGFPDSTDYCPYTASSKNLDSDGDGVGDVCDNCPTVSNANQLDADRDGKGDACDNAPNFWNPVFHDKNGNGIDDPTEANANQLAWDTDGDGAKDNIDPCPTVNNAVPGGGTDSDGDGIPNICDNCPGIANANQKDVNHDGFGDACKPPQGPYVTCGVYLVEQPIYGLGREGSVMASGGLDITLPVHDTVYTRKLGEKYYELSDQLGSARMVISDRKLSDLVSGVPGKYRAEVKTFTNLYPFGMEEPGRYMTGDGYRYGYQGMEKDSTSGGERYTTTYRLYDARLGRWLSVDPVTDASSSPYVAMGNNPVLIGDPSGAEGDTLSGSGHPDTGPYAPGTIYRDDKSGFTYQWFVKDDGSGAWAMEGPGVTVESSHASDNWSMGLAQGSLLPKPLDIHNVSDLREIQAQLQWTRAQIALNEPSLASRVWDRAKVRASTIGELAKTGEGREILVSSMNPFSQPDEIELDDDGNVVTHSGDNFDENTAPDFIIDLGTIFLVHNIGEGSGLAAVEEERSMVPRINGRRPINSVYAGRAFPLSEEMSIKYPNGVRFNERGFPDFSEYVVREVVIKEGLIGDAYEDFKLANEAAGFSATPKDYTWHHKEDGVTMQLVPTDIHKAVRHTGGAAIIRQRGAR